MSHVLLQNDLQPGRKRKKEKTDEIGPLSHHDMHQSTTSPFDKTGNFLLSFLHISGPC